MKIKEILTIWMEKNKENLPLIDLLVELRENKNLTEFELRKKQEEIERKFFEEKAEFVWRTLLKINIKDNLYEIYDKFWKEVGAKYKLMCFDAFVDIEQNKKDPLLEKKVKNKLNWIKDNEKIYLLMWLEALSKGLLRQNFLRNTLFSNLKQLLETALRVYNVIDDAKWKNNEKEIKSKITEVVNYLIHTGLKLNWIGLEGGTLGTPFTWKITNSLIINHVLIYSFIYNMKLPMLVKPRPWKKKVKNEKLYYMGGYLSSDALDNLGLTGQIGSHKVSDINEDFLKAINYLQNQALSINEPYLDFLLSSDPKDFLNDEFTYKIEISTKIGKSFSTETVEKSINLEETLLKEINKEELAEFVLCSEIIENLYILDSLRKYKFYYVFFVDFRGRLYPYGYPLSFYTNKLFKNCFIFAPEIKEPLINYDYYLFYYEKLDQFSKKNFELNLKNSHPSNILIGLDACASAFQIQGCLIKDRNLLKLTNILETSETHLNNELVYKDLYTWIGNFFNLETIVNNFISKYLTLNDKFKIKKLFKDRKFLKSLIVPYSYNEGFESRKKKIEDQIEKIIISSTYKKSEIYNISFLISKEFDIFINKEFPKLEILKNFLKEIAKLKKNEGVLIKNSHFSFIQQYPKSKVVESYKMIKGVRSRFKYIEYNPNEIDIKKQKIALLPNFIHSLDSAILIKVLLKCKKKKIKIYTIHDCFYINFYDISNIIEIYASSFVEILLNKEEDLLFNLAFNNSLHENKIIKKYLDILTNDKFSEEEIQNILRSQVCLKP